MSLSQAILLGLVQGFTEFLPISSSGHLTLFHQFMGFGTSNLVFDIFIHAGTLLAVLIYFKDQLKSFFSNKLPHVVVGTLPAVVVGFLIYQYEPTFFSDLRSLAFGFLLTSSILFLDYFLTTTGTSLAEVTLKQSFLVGVFQALAILPSVSRSGSTIVGGRLTGLTRQAAFSFSFLLSIPAILAAITLAAKDVTSLSLTPLPLLFGLLSALVSGFFALKLLDLLFRRNDLLPFAIYTFILGTLLLGLTS